MNKGISIRDEIGAIFEVYIPKGQWRILLDELDREGKPTRKQTNSILLSFGQHIEALEDRMAELEATSSNPFKDEVLSSTTTQTATSNAPAEIYSAQGIIQALKEEPTTDVHYIDAVRWDILVTQIKKEAKKLNPELMYGKEIEPKTGHQKTCIFSNALGTTPIFRA